MSIVDDIKELFSTHAHDLTQRMHGIENHLGTVAAANNVVAAALNFDVVTTRAVIPAAAEKYGAGNGIEVISAPPGTFLELRQWTWSAPANELPILLLNGDNNAVVDVSEAAGPLKVGVSHCTVIIPEARQLFVVNKEVKQETLCYFQFRRYTMQSEFVTSGKAAGEES